MTLLNYLYFNIFLNTLQVINKKIFLQYKKNIKNF
nr:MAG TPA: hypothetical protein [Caudoviricetes sp.]